MIDPKMRARLKELKEYNFQMIQQIAEFRKLGEHTVDVDMTMSATEDLAIRAKTELFGNYKMWRFDIGKASPLFLKSMANLGEEIEEQCFLASQAWKYPDSQMIRDSDSALFFKRERIEGPIRDNIITLSELKQIAYEYKKRYGAHENILSDRQFGWAQILAGALLGVATTLLVQYLLDKLT